MHKDDIKFEVVCSGGFVGAEKYKLCSCQEKAFLKITQIGETSKESLFFCKDHSKKIAMAIQMLLLHGLTVSTIDKPKKKKKYAQD
jgi:hypothetical protein